MQNYIPFFQGEKRSVTEKLAKYFEYSNLESKIHFDEEKLVYILSIPADKEKEAKKFYQDFYFEERERIENQENNENSHESLDEYDESNVLSRNSFEENIIDADLKDITSRESSLGNIPSNEGVSDSDQVVSDEDSLGEDSLDEVTSDEDSLQKDASDKDYLDEETSDDDSLHEDALDEASSKEDPTEDDNSEVISNSPTNLLSGSGSYVMKSEKYKDYQGTYYVFLFMGIAGIIFVILNITEVFTLLNGLFPNLIMGALFLFFIYVGISTGIKAKSLKYEIEEENQLTEKINNWLSKNVTKEFLDSISNKDISTELDYIKKAETIREMLIKECGDIDPDYLDRLIEEFYTENFDN